MNIRKTLLAGALSLGLLGSIVAPMAIASPPTETGSNPNSVGVEVVITGGGGFDAFFCVPGVGTGPVSTPQNWTGTPQTTNTLLTGTEPTAGTPGHATGAMVICYEDSLNQRPNFNTQVISSQFTSPALPSTPIDASNFRITRTDNVAQNQWGWVNGIDIGEIGSFGENGYVAQNSLPAFWTTNSLRSLDVARTVQFGYAGQGTVFSFGSFNVELNIPAGTSAGTYTSTVTLTLIPGTQ